MPGVPKSSPTRGLFPALAIALLWAMGGGAWAAPDFPASYETAALKEWLGRTTDLKVEDVVAVSRTSLAAISRRRSDVSGSVFAHVRSEALDPGLFAREGAASWAVEVEVACDVREIRAAETQGYPLHNLKGAGTVLREADRAWRRPTAGTQLDSVVRAVCEPAFKGPLTVAASAASPAGGTGAKPRRPSTPSGAEAQVLASSSRDQADRARDELGAQNAALDVRVTPAVVAGATVYRVVAGGFADDAAAAAFCREIRASGGQCFVRGGGALARRR